MRSRSQHCRSYLALEQCGALDLDFSRALLDLGEVVGAAALLVLLTGFVQRLARPAVGGGPAAARAGA